MVLLWGKSIGFKFHLGFLPGVGGVLEAPKPKVLKLPQGCIQLILGYWAGE